MFIIFNSVCGNLEFSLPLQIAEYITVIFYYEHFSNGLFFFCISLMIITNLSDLLRAPLDKLRANLLHLQFLANNCMYSSHTDVKLFTYCLYRHTAVLIHEILYLAYKLWCSDFLTPPTPLIIPHRLPAFLESLMPLKNWCSIHARWSIPYVSVRFFPSLKHNFIAYRSSKVSDYIFEIHQLWQSGFSRM